VSGATAATAGTAHDTLAHHRVGSALAEQTLHLGDLGLLAVDDLLGQRLGVGAAALGQFCLVIMPCPLTVPVVAGDKVFTG